MVANSPHYSPYFKSTCPSDQNVIFFLHHQVHNALNDITMTPSSCYNRGHICPSSPLTRDGHICPSSPVRVNAISKILKLIQLHMTYNSIVLFLSTCVCAIFVDILHLLSPVFLWTAFMSNSVLVSFFHHTSNLSWLYIQHLLKITSWIYMSVWCSFYIKIE